MPLAWAALGMGDLLGPSPSGAIRGKGRGCGSRPTCAIKSAAHCWTEEPGVAPPATLLLTKSSTDDAHSRRKFLNRFAARAV
jgi:hypothetical protein